MFKSSSFFLLIGVLSLLVIAACSPVIVASAAPALGAVRQESAPALPDFPGLLKTLESLTGFAMLVAVLVNIGKTSGYIKDNQAQAYSAGFNLLLLGVLFVSQIFGKANLVPSLDAQAGELSNVLGVVFAFFWQIWVSRQSHNNFLAGLPWIGKSFSERNAGEEVSYLLETDE